MKHFFRMIFISLLASLFFSCNSNRTDKENFYSIEEYKLLKYDSVVILSDPEFYGTQQLMEMPNYIRDILSKTRLKRISKKEAAALPPEKQENVLALQYMATHTSDEAVIFAKFLDYNTNKVVQTCRGSSMFILIPMSINMNIALKRLQKSILKSFDK